MSAYCEMCDKWFKRGGDCKLCGAPLTPAIKKSAVDAHPGMSMRDWFAGHALNGVLAANANERSNGAIPVDDDAALFVAEHCYRYADAMLKAREVTHP